MHHEFSRERLRKLRKRARLSQRQVVELSRVSEATLYRLESDHSRPYTTTLEKLLNLYQIRISYWKNMGQALEEPFNGGYITGEAVIGFGSPGFDVGGTEKKAADERPLRLPHGLLRVSG